MATSTHISDELFSLLNEAIKSIESSCKDDLLISDCVIGLKKVKDEEKDIENVVYDDNFVILFGSSLIRNTANLRRQVYELLSKISLFSYDCFLQVLEIMNFIQDSTGQSERFSILLDELTWTTDIDNIDTILSFINTLIVCGKTVDERVGIRNELIGCGILDIFNDSQFKSHRGLIMQKEAFMLLRAEDEDILLGETVAADRSGRFIRLLERIEQSPHSEALLQTIDRLNKIEAACSNKAVLETVFSTIERIENNIAEIRRPSDVSALMKTNVVSYSTFSLPLSSYGLSTSQGFRISELSNLEKSRMSIQKNLKRTKLLKTASLCIFPEYQKEAYQTKSSHTNSYRNIQSLDLANVNPSLLNELKTKNLFAPTTKLSLDLANTAAQTILDLTYDFPFKIDVLNEIVESFESTFEQNVTVNIVNEDAHLIEDAVFHEVLPLIEQCTQTSSCLSLLSIPRVISVDDFSLLSQPSFSKSSRQPLSCLESALNIVLNAILDKIPSNFTCPIFPTGYLGRYIT